MMNLQSKMSEKGVDIELMASFDSFSFLPTWIALGYNNINPALVLYPDRLELKTTGRSRLQYAKIKHIDARRTVKTRNIIFYIKRSLSRRAANVRDQQQFLDALEFFKSQGITLTDTAQSFLDER
jgi:hypothetical protein